jgi:hypothetical protein
MDRVIILHFGEQFELVDMGPYMLIFGKPPSFNELVARVGASINIGCELRLHRRYDMGATD